MASRKKTLVVGGIAVAGLFLVQGLAPLHLDLSRNVTDFTQTGTSSHMNGALPLADAWVEVEGDSALAARVRDAFVRQGRFKVGAPGKAAAPAILRLQLEDASTWWTPFWADSRLELKVSFASDGDLSDLHTFMPHEADPASAVIRGEARFRFHSRAFGLVSRSTYLDRLADEIATDTSKHFRTSMGW